MHSTPSLEDFCRNIAMMFGVEKTRMAWLTDSEKKIKDGFIRFDRIQERDKQTQRHTDKHTETHRQTYRHCMTT